jgi:type I restriction enzyme, S subunit
MIADLKAYPEYKESGLPWLGEVPRHWEIRRLKSTAANVIEQTTVMNVDEAYVALEHVESWTGRVRAQFGSKLFTGQVKRFKSNDVLFGKLRPYLAKVARVGQNGVCAGEFFVLRPTNALLSTAYLEHQLRAKYTIDIINSSTFGAKMPRADWQFCGNLLIPLPPPAEQTAIVRFLDQVNGRLGRAIRAKRKVIALLNEQKDAIIHRTVTRGLDPSAPLKDSGVPWLGDIPAHWEVRRLSAVANFRSGKAHEPFVAEAGAHICVTARFVSTNGSASKHCSRNLCRARHGDVLMVMSDLPKGRALARAYLVRDNRSYAVNQRVCAITARSLDPRLLAYCANRNWHLLRNDDGLNQTHLSNYDFKTMPIVLPPANEQKQIADYLDVATSQAERTAERLQRECELLLEYQSRLVDYVVTGKLDVRAVAAMLPAEEPLSDTADSRDSDDELYTDTDHTADTESKV